MTPHVQDNLPLYAFTEIKLSTTSEELIKVPLFLDSYSLCVERCQILEW